MRVKVSYTLNLEEVPMLLDGLLTECRKKLTNEANSLNLSLHDVSAAINQVSQTRDTLSMVESQLEDVVNLIVGWHEATTGRQAPLDIPDALADDLDVKEERD